MGVTLWFPCQNCLKPFSDPNGSHSAILGIVFRSCPFSVLAPFGIWKAGHFLNQQVLASFCWLFLPFTFDVSRSRVQAVLQRLAWASPEQSLPHSLLSSLSAPPTFADNGVARRLARGPWHTAPLVVYKTFLVLLEVLWQCSQCPEHFMFSLTGCSVLPLWLRKCY